MDSDLLFYLKDHNFIGYYQYIVFPTEGRKEGSL